MEVMAGYKQTEIGILPDDWKTLEYGKCLNIIAGLGFKKSEYSDIGIRLLRIDNVSYGQITWESIAYLPPEYSRKFPHLMLEEGDILLALNRPIANNQLKIAKIQNEDLPAILYQRVGRIGFVNDQIDKDFAYHVLRIYIRKFVEDSSVGSDQPFISTTKLKKILLPIPPSNAEQEAIAEALSDADALIEALEQLLTKKHQVKQGAMQELLTGKRRLPGFSGEWTVKPLDTISFVTSGKRLPLGKSLTGNETSHPYIRVTDMRMGTVELSDIKFVPDDVFPPIKQYRIYKEDIFISVAGTLGIVGKIPPELDGANLTENADRITNINCSQDYLLHILMSPIIQNTIEALQTVGAQPKLALTRIRKFDIPLPPTIAEQTAIAEILSDMDVEIAALEGKLSKARQVKQGMMSELLTGRVRLV